MADADRGDSFTPTENDDVAVLENDQKPVVEDPKVDDKSDAKGDDKPAEGAADVDADKAKEKVPEPRIPLSRHKQLLETERGRTQALETQLAAAMKAGNTDQANADRLKDETEIQKLEEQYTKQMLDGDVKDATKTMGDIRRLERAVSERSRGVEIAAAEARAVERVRYDTIVERLEEAYPQIRPGHDDYDQAAVGEVLELKEAYELKGYQPSAALQKAMKYVFAATTRAQDVATNVTPRADADDVKAATAEERKTAAVAKALDAAGKTPPSTSKLGLDSDKAGGGILDAKAVMKMSQKDFAALGEDQLARLRGDAL